MSRARTPPGDGPLPSPRRTASGLPRERLYGPADVTAEPGAPGEFPFTRGLYPGGYRERLWTMRQYAGFGTATESNRRFRYLLDQGTTGLSVAFDLPTQIGYDSDDPHSLGEVGRVGVAIDSLEDMELLFDGIPLDRVSTSMTINSTAAILLALYIAVARRRGIAEDSLKGTIQNDILKEYIARGTWIFPPGPSLRLVTDVFAYCAERVPRWNTISISGYHIREAGATAPQEIAFTLANGLEYVRAARAVGLDPGQLGRRISFFFACHSDFLEEVAKFRCLRRLWARLMKETFGVTDPRALQCRFHVQTGGVTLTAPAAGKQRRPRRIAGARRGPWRQPEPAHQRPRRSTRASHRGLGPPRSAHPADHCLRVRCGGHGGPARWQLRSRGGDRCPGARGGPDSRPHRGAGWRSAGHRARGHHSGRSTSPRTDSRDRSSRGIVSSSGSTASRRMSRPRPGTFSASTPSWSRRRSSECALLRARRDPARWAQALDALEGAARSDDNLVPAIIEAVVASATVGEIAGRFREVFGEHKETLLP